jgi:tetratricopeptide (TPR) repeat protein
VVRYAPDHSEAYFLLGTACRKQGKTGQAVGAYFNSLRGQNPPNPEALYYLGILLISQNKWEGGAENLEKAVKLDNTNAVYCLELGKCLTHLEQNSRALKILKKSVALNPNSAEAHYQIGLLEFWEGDYLDAVTRFSNAVELKPEYTSAHLQLGIIYKEQEKFEEAIEEFIKTIECDPDLCEAHFNIAYVYKEQENYLKAVNHYQEYLRLKPDANNADTVRQYIDILIEKQRLKRRQ